MTHSRRYATGLPAAALAGIGFGGFSRLTPARASLGRMVSCALHRIAGGGFDLAFLNFSVLSRFACAHPADAPLYVLSIVDASPASVVTWKLAGVRHPSDLTGKRLSAIETDGPYQLFNTYPARCGYRF
ncbi:MAG: hypothetical protein INR70_22035 [Parafilimonas terrae]|nr:hypothetical protein [Parafilimonas terrae]